MADQAAIQNLLDKQDCIELIYKFARGLDRLDLELIRGLFHPGGTDDHGIFNGPVEEYIPWLGTVLGAMKITQHHIGNVLIELESPVLAHGETYYVAHHEMNDKDGNPIHYVAAGRYLDRFERRDGGPWKIAHRLAVSEWSTQHASTDFWDRTVGPRTYGTRDRTDPLYKR